MPDNSTSIYKNLESKFDTFLTDAIAYTPRLILAVLVFWLGFKLVKKLMRIYDDRFATKKLSEEIRPFFGNMLNFGMKLIVILTAVNLIGVKTSSFAALIAAVGFAIGMALQGSLGNLAAGVMILIFKPFRVGDTVIIHGNEGQVSQIDTFNTIVLTYDNKKVIIPNGMAIGEIITNVSDKPYLRVDMHINLPYSESFDKVKSIIYKALMETEHVISTPEPFIGIDNFESHGIRVAVYPFCKPEHYWIIYYTAKENVKKALGENGIKMAYIEGVAFGEIAE
ncbi:MAG: mechanosensitive ion channel family protein [Flavobacteriales bacterium]